MSQSILNQINNFNFMEIYNYIHNIYFEHLNFSMILNIIIMGSAYINLIKSTDKKSIIGNSFILVLSMFIWLLFTYDIF